MYHAFVSGPNCYQNFIDTVKKCGDIDQNATTEIASAFEAFRELAKTAESSLLGNPIYVSDHNINEIQNTTLAPNKILRNHLNVLIAYFTGSGAFLRHEELRCAVAELGRVIGADQPTFQ